MDVLDGVGLLAERRGHRVHADRPAAELVDDRAEQPAIDFVEAAIVDLEHAQRGLRDLERDDAVGAHLGVVAHPVQQPVGDARGAARAPGHLARRLRIDRRGEDAGRAPDDLVDVVHGVEVEPVDDAEPGPQRRGEQPGPRRRPDQREALDRHLDRPRAGALADDDVELEVLHRRIEDLLDRRRQPVDLVDEQHLAGLQARQHAGQVARLLDHRPGGGADGGAHLVGDDVGQRRLAETRAVRRAGCGRAPRRGAWPPRSRRSGSRGRGPGRCSRRAGAGAVPASYCASSSALAADTSRPSLMTGPGPSRRRAQRRVERRRIAGRELSIEHLVHG